MKKIVLIIIMGLCAFPACAQWRTLSGWTSWNGRTGWNGVRKSAASAPRVAGNVEKAVTRALVQVKPPMATHIQITNLSGKPFVKLATPLPVKNGVLGNPFPILQARVLSGEENYKHLLPDRGGFFPPVYVPEALNAQEEAGFRGLKLYNLRDVQHILEYGLEYRKVTAKMENKIYFADGVYHAAGYITDNDSSYLELPTLVRFKLLPDKSNIYANVSLFFDLNYYYWAKNIPSGYIQDVMVFLEVEGVPGWYKATLENGELVLAPAPSRVFKSSELIKHDFQIPGRNIEETW
ncbi:MAG: hypothetical protein IKP06_04115 [Elusimicrobiaceae bacterium]|nr:hypothetical protein [Elusimicrobiaceae bacterium]